MARALWPKECNEGSGFVAMRERAELIGGVLAIAPRAPAGTLVRLEVPREKAEVHGA